MMQAVSGLRKSRKAVLVLVVVITLTTMTALGKIDQEHYLSLLKWIIPAWLGAYAWDLWEEGKRRNGDA